MRGPQAATLIADALNLSRAEGHGVFPSTTTLPMLRETGGGEFRSVVPACQARGVEAVARPVIEKLGLPTGDPWGGSTRDGAVTVVAAYCLGLCAVWPGVLSSRVPAC